MRVNSSGKVITSAQQYFQSPLISGDSINTDQLLIVVKSVLEQAKITQKYVAVAIPEKFAYSKEHVLPNLNNEEIDEAVNWQIEKIFPFSKKDVYTDWKLISKTKTESKVMATVIPKNILDQLKAVLQAAGVSPISFEPSASALTRLLKPEASQKLIILELENTSTTASLVLDGIAIFTSTTNFTANTPPETVVQQIIGSIQGIYLHLEKLELPKNELTITITGEKANQQTAEHLQQTLQLPVKLMEVSDIPPENHLVYIAASVNILPPESEKSINLLPANLQNYYQEQINYHLSRRTTLYTITFTVIGLLCSSLIFGAIFWTKTQTQTQLEQIKQQAQFVGTNNVNLGEINKKSQRIVKLFPTKVSPEQYLIAVYNSIPDNVTLQQVHLSAGGKNITITGVVKDRETIVQLRDAIQDSGVFTTPKIPLSSYQDVENTRFELNFQVKQGL